MVMDRIFSMHCDSLAGDFTLPSAITFDKWGNLWLLENNIFAPTVKRIDY